MTLGGSGGLEDSRFEWFEADDDARAGELHPLPLHLSYIHEIALRYHVSGWNERTLAVRLDRLSGDELNELSNLCGMMSERGHGLELGQWVLARRLQEARLGNPDEPLGSELGALLMMFAMLAKRGLEPFTSRKVPGFEASERRPYEGPAALCEATRAAPAECVLPTGDPARWMRLSHAAADRVEARALAPLEWYRLVALHGRKPYFLWSEFYGATGEALQPTAYVPPDSSRAPTLFQVRDRLDDLLEYVAVYYEHDPAAAAEVRNALAHFPAPDILASLAVASRNLPHSPAARLSWRLRVDLGHVDEGDFRQRWVDVSLDDVDDVYEFAELARDSVGVLSSADTLHLVLEALDRLKWPNSRADTPEVYFGLPAALAYQLKDRMGDDFLLELVLELLLRLPAERRAGQVLHALTLFRSERVLQWIEEHVVEPVTYEWGTAAALNGATWERIARWIARGRPWSLVALDAMKNCRGFSPDDPHMSGILRNASPKVLGRPPLDQVRSRLYEYQRRDPDPHAQEAVKIILAHLPRILDS